MLRVLRDSRGATTVELTVVAPVLFAFSIVALELLRLCFTGLTIQFVAAKALRQAVISPTSAQGIAATVSDLGARFGVPIAPEQIEVCHLIGDGTCVGGGSAPGSNELLVIKVARPTALLLFGNYTLRGLVIGRNEPYGAQGSVGATH